MAQDLRQSTIGTRLEGAAGTGFVVADHLAVTTSHLVGGYQEIIQHELSTYV